MRFARKIVIFVIMVLLLSSGILLSAETDTREFTLGDNRDERPKYITLERQPDGTDVVKEQSPIYNMAHLLLFEHILKALDTVYEQNKEELSGMDVGSIVVVYEYPGGLDFNFLSDEKKVKKEIRYTEPKGEVLIRSALVIFDFFEVDGKIDTNLVSFLQTTDGTILEDDVELEYSIEKGSWVVRATGYVTKTRFFVTAKTKVQLSTEVAKKNIARKVAAEYQYELKKLGAEEIVIEQKLAS